MRGKRKATKNSRVKKLLFLTLLLSLALCAGGMVISLNSSNTLKHSEKIVTKEPEVEIVPDEIIKETPPSEPIIVAPEFVLEEKGVTIEKDPWLKEKKLIKNLEAKKFVLVKDPTLLKNTVFKVGSFNVLGASHTTGKKAKKGYKTAQARLPKAIQFIRQSQLSVVGLQEFQNVQASLFSRIASEYDVYPGNAGGYTVQNSIAWRKDTWTLIEAHKISIPYFGGHSFLMPYIKLENKNTGEQIWFANFHNPANTHGNAQKYRIKARGIQTELAKKLSANDTSVVYTGDFNESASYACPFSQATGFVSADGTFHKQGKCTLGERATRIDWIFYKNLEKISYSFNTQPQATKTTDHPLVSTQLEKLSFLAPNTCQTVTIKNVTKKYCLSRALNGS